MPVELIDKAITYGSQAGVAFAWLFIAGLLYFFITKHFEYVKTTQESQTSANRELMGCIEKLISRIDKLEAKHDHHSEELTKALNGLNTMIQMVNQSIMGCKNRD